MTLAALAYRPLESSKKFSLGHRLLSLSLPPIKIPTTGPRLSPRSFSIRILPCSFSLSDRTNDGKTFSVSRPIDLNSFCRFWYLFITGGLGSRTLNQLSHLPFSPIRKRALEKPTINAPNAALEPLTSTAKSYFFDRICRKRAMHDKGSFGNPGKTS